MNLNKAIAAIDIKTLLSTLWLFVLLNIIFRDIHELFRTGFLNEVMTGTVNGVVVTEELLLLGGLMIEIPIAMVLLSRLLAVSPNRWLNIIAAAITMAILVGNGTTDLDDTFFATIEVVSLSLIIWFAWKWPNPDLSPNQSI